MPAFARYLIPLGIFLLLVALLFRGLSLNPRQVPSPLIGKPAPGFSLPRLHAPGRLLTEADLQGQVALVNVWATWCSGCRAEHGVLMALARSGRVPIYGLNYKDARADARQWLARHGDPYRAVAVDAEGRVGIDWGVYGAPETYVLDRDGVIRHKHIGVLTAEDVEEDILPLVERLRENRG
ncbi:MAG TPA: DsbE family thiol:disulfide interchange protein [Thiohalobacter sp.]|nr:DsbE family thiol:disulfide interchange protein [Thiohalobacter sp.]